MTTITIEACNDGTITRACARAINRALATGFSGSTLVDDVLAHMRTAAYEGFDFQIVGAASLTGADKARHTREVTRSRKAQARRAVAKAELVAAQQVAIDAHARRPLPFPRSA